MIRLNALQYNPIKLDLLEESYSLDTLISNDKFEDLCLKYKENFGYSKLKTFSFSKEGFLGLLLELNGKIAVSVGECEALIQGAKIYESLGFDIAWLGLNKDGKVNIEKLKDENIDFLFLSSYVMDTFVKTNLELIKKLTNAKIISNASANFDKNSDVIYFDAYKLTGFFTHSLILFNNDLFEEQIISQKDAIALRNILEALKEQKFELEMKNIFKEKLQKLLKDDIYFFVDEVKTLPYTLHIGLKNIKARELIRTLALDEIYVSNGEGCSLGLSKPSRVIQTMGHDELTSRNAITFSFCEKYDENTIEKIVNKIAKRYLQIKVLNQGN